MNPDRAWAEIVELADRVMADWNAHLHEDMSHKSGDGAQMAFLVLLLDNWMANHPAGR